MEGDQHSHQTPPRQHSTPLLGLGLPVPVITRTSSLPATPSLEWDRSCLQEPLLLDAGNLLGIERLEDRRVSDTDPHLVDNQKILLVSTDSSSLDSTFEKLLESAGNIPSTAMSAMENEADDLFVELDTLTGRVMANPVTDMEEELVDSFVTRLERLTNDVENCLGLFNVWKRKHRNESNATLKEQVEQEVTSMENTFRAYRKSIADKKKQLQPSGPPPPAVGMPSGGSSDQILIHMQREQRSTMDLQVNTKRIQIQGAMNQLLSEVMVRSWEEADDRHVQEAMRQLQTWNDRKLKIGEQFLEFQAMMETWQPSQVSTPDSDFQRLKKEVKDFEKDLVRTIGTIKNQDEERNLGSLEKAPTSLMDYPHFGGLESQCFFQWEEKMVRALRTNKVPAIDQVAKIRSVLSGHPLSMVPESVKLAKSALDTLRSRYGDEDRVMLLRVKELKKMGPKPDRPKDQVTWYTDLLGKLQRLLELGEKNEDLARVAFSGDIFSSIMNLFPDKEMLKLAKLADVHGRYTKQRMEDLIKRLDEKRQDANLLDKVMVQKDKDKGSGGGAGAGGTKTHATHLAGPPSRNPDCRICKVLLSEIGTKVDLFKDHLGKHPTHCPIFVKMTLQERVRVMTIAKLCWSCLDPKSRYSYASSPW